MHPNSTNFQITTPLSLVVLQPTSFCNIDCSYCYLPHRNKKRDLALDTIQTIVSRLLEYNYFEETLTICWHSGEPFTRGIEFFDQAFREFERLSKVVKVSHSIQTNGTLLDETWATWLANNNVHVGLSIDGPQSMHDENRVYRSGAGSHRKALEASRLLIDKNISFGAIAVISNAALASPETFHQFFVNSGIHSVGLNVPEIEGINTVSWIKENDSDNQFYAFTRALLRCSRDGPIRYRELEYIFDVAASSQRDFKSSNATLGHILNVAWDGSFSSFAPELLSMSYDNKDFLFGNLASQSISDGFAAEKAQKLSKLINDGIDNCRYSCEFFNICGGGSPSNKIAENDDLASTETHFCNLTKKVLTRAILDHFNV